MSEVQTNSAQYANTIEARTEAVTMPGATPAKRKRGKSLSRRTGQSGHLEKSGRWIVVRFWKDIPGQDKRVLVRVRVCPISGPGSLSKSAQKRRAKEIIQASGVDSPEYFNEVVKPISGGVTFREQSELWLKRQQTRRRKPIGQSYAGSIQGALDKWILPAIGDLPLGSVDNLSVKPLIEKMCSGDPDRKLGPRTVNKYMEHVKQVVDSLKGPNGEPVYKRTWDAELMDLPVVEYAKQKRPSVKAKAISDLIAGSSGQEQALYVLLAATGMRISEALAVETRHFINGGRTIKVEQQVKKDSPRIVEHLKTSASWRQIDLHPDVAEFLQRYAAGKAGLLFHTANGTPHLYGNLEERWLTPRLKKMGLDEKGMGWHAFKRFRKTWLRGQRCLEDINNHWMAHKPKTMSEVYSHLHEEVEMRLAEAERVGFGFVLPKTPSLSVVPNVPKSLGQNGREVAA